MPVSAGLSVLLACLYVEHRPPQPEVEAPVYLGTTQARHSRAPTRSPPILPRVNACVGFRGSPIPSRASNLVHVGFAPYLWSMSPAPWAPSGPAPIPSGANSTNPPSSTARARSPSRCSRSSTPGRGQRSSSHNAVEPDFTAPDLTAASGAGQPVEKGAEVIVRMATIGYDSGRTLSHQGADVPVDLADVA